MTCISHFVLTNPDLKCSKEVFVSLSCKPTGMQQIRNEKVAIHFWKFESRWMSGNKQT